LRVSAVKGPTPVLLTFGDFPPIMVTMSDMAGHMLVADVPAGAGVDQVSHALMRGRFHHVRDTIGPVARLWVYCPGDPRDARSRVRHIIETALADQHTPMPVMFTDEHHHVAPPATRTQSPMRPTSSRAPRGEHDQRASVGSHLRKAG
jgi:hypothetical protein